MSNSEAYVGLARKYRPQTFDDLVGQEAVANSLSQALRQNKVVHGHMLAGPRGTGKTTTARILARALNCVEGPTASPCGVCRHCIDIAAGNDMDVIEIDGASNNGVDNIRELRERVNLAPFSARHKVYIIDEVHMLSTAAFNALLKTLEEPPAGVVFIMATTELEKVPETIRSRCALHQFRRLTTDDLIRRLTQVAEREGIALTPEQAREIFGPIARAVDGGMRDALVILDQLFSLTDGKPTAEGAIKLLGLADASALANTVAWVAEGKAVELLGLVEDLVGRGRSLERYVKEVVAYLRDLMLLNAGVGDGLVALTGEGLARARSQAEQIATPTLYNMLNQFFELEERIKKSTQARFLVEFTLLRLAQVKPVVPIDRIMQRIQALPDQTLAGGAASAPAAATPPPAARRETEPEPVAPQPDAPEAQRPEAARPEPARPRPARPTLAFAAMHESAPEAPEPPQTAAAAPGAGGGATPEALAGLDREELIRLVLNELPDTLQGLFARYFRQAAGLRVEGASFCLYWDPDGPSYGRKTLEKIDNQRALEAALAQIAGRAVAVVNLDAPPEMRAASAAQPPESREVHVAAPTAAGRMMADSHPDEEGSESDDAAEPGELVYRSETPPAPEPARKPEPPKDTRGALEKAQAFLSLNEEAARRLKMLRTMFHGRVIDENGEALPI